MGFLASTEGILAKSLQVCLWEFSSQHSSDLRTPPATRKTTRHNKRDVILVSLVACVVGVTIGGLAMRWLVRATKLSKHGKEESRELDERFAQGPRKFSYAELCAATKNFNHNEILGKGGFGGVYRGTLPLSNQPVAVKRICQGSKQGIKEYISEVSIISKIRHRNLVQLHGWCHEKGQLLLVYEFLPKRSLDKYLFGEQWRDDLNWNRRYSIGCDIASALLYLHDEWDQRVIHRDLKASNVMLDDDFNAKLGDFGLARVVERKRAASHTTVVVGTFGYIAPECVITGKASLESDIFSFGAVSLEIACGRRAVDRSLEDHCYRLVEWVWDLFGQGKVLDAADTKLDGNFNCEEMERLMLVGLLCSHPDPKARLNIRQVIDILKLKAPRPHVPPTYPVAVYSAGNGPVAELSTTSDGSFCTPENAWNIEAP
ncbi:L-type lectin-domain containing receptor kinase IX.1-like [Cryptomeria japonica]|uniref:L-type lectin-domain containing receptor kinase IX.1-like n=1 Tax=Cryptomeria japonica TaxID=3369 RepID=UPI0027DA848B|nr:L-type lectin-domain containing receptor kinase IX.1-like [Cryptomeria japonica]